jgi:UDP-N-acetylmuramoylalanine--D-glutamate ligase
MDWRGVRVAVWGAAKSGVAAANLLAELGADVVLSDTRTTLELDGLDPRVTVRSGGNVLDGARVLVPSPGIPPGAPALAAAVADGVRLVSEIELAVSVATAPVVAITGTDGKSTTTAMIGAVVAAAGRPVVVAGNIGDPLSAHARDVGADGVVVAEVSAFQLWTCGYFRPRVAVMTNIAEDHADYFANDRAAYVAAKARVFGDQGPGDTAVLRADDATVMAMATPSGVARVPFSPRPLEAGWGFADGWLTRDGERVMAADALPVKGPHNVANALAALASGAALGVPLEAMVEGLRTFRPLPHRLERVAEKRGVLYLDDSKATNPHAAAIGLRSLDAPLVVLAGGYDKGLDQGMFVDELVRRARHVVLVGGTAARTASEIAGRVPTSIAPDMDAAVRLAASIAQPGDTVVLSPASSSFDLYRSYHHRGEVFQAAVRALAD